MSVVSIQAWSISSSGRVLQTDRKSLATESSYPNFVLFSDDRVKVLTIAGAEDGAVVGYEIVRSGRLPLGGERFALEGLLPVRLGEVHVSIPSGSLRWFVNHPDRVEVVSQSPTAASFRSLNRPAIPQEDSAPPFQTVAAAVFVNHDPKGTVAVQSWEDAGRAIHPLLSGAEKPAPEIANQVESLSAGQADLLSKLNATYTFVSRQIRYVAVEIGIGGFEPHPAADVFRNKYGDCKDKATLLLTMLDHLGLRGPRAGRHAG
jgi:transglutaminase-like putative cysteine protease